MFGHQFLTRILQMYRRTSHVNLLLGITKVMEDAAAAAPDSQMEVDAGTTQTTAMLADLRLDSTAPATDPACNLRPSTLGPPAEPPTSHADQPVPPSMCGDPS